MPELPEVETVRAGLAQHVIGARVDSIDILDERSLKRYPPGPAAFRSELIGQRFQAVVRRGKFFWLPISDSLALSGHLGMSGQVLVRTPDAPADAQARIILSLTKPSGERIEFRFIDQRIFGSLAIAELVPTSDGGAGGYAPEGGVDSTIPIEASHIARDPLDPLFDFDWVVGRLRSKNTEIKRALLDQNLVSGIGNIYADESLWRSRIHYAQQASEISTRKLKELVTTATEVLREAVAQGGTSFDEQYKNVNGESGYFVQELAAYGQTGKPCPRCGTPIRRDSWANRGSHFCPRCQRLKR